MVCILRWTDMILHDKAVDMHRSGYRSKDVRLIMDHYRMPYEDAERVCGFIAEMEGEK